MAYEIETILNKGQCSVSNMKGLREGYCPFDITRLAMLLRFDYGYTFSAGFQFTKENLVKLIQGGKMKVIRTLKNANWDTPENGAQTYDGGDMYQTDKFPMKYSAIINGGTQGHQGLVSVERARTHSFLLVDKEGQIWLSEANGTVRAINSNYMDVSPYMPAGNEAGASKITSQLERGVFDNSLSVIKPEELGFDIFELHDFFDVVIDLTAPSNSSNTLTFTAVRKTDKHDLGQGGLVTANVRLKVGNTTVAGTLSYSSGVYTFTRTAGTFSTGDAVTLSTWDNTESSYIVDVDGTLLKSNIATTVAVA